MIELRDYQRQAVDAWFENDNRGIFRMATGTGKTYTALGALDQFYSERSNPLLVVITVPYTHLASQWEEELRDWGYSATQAFGSQNRQWNRDLSRILADLRIGIRNLEIVITTHATASKEEFQDLISGSTDSLLIADEMHSLGAPHYQNVLLDDYQFRLGLSATPERYYDEEGTDVLLNYFEGVVFEFSLEDAIPEYLTPYEYYPVIVELTSEELQEYRELSTRLGQLFARAEDDDETIDEEVIQRLQMKRARIIKAAQNKFDALEDTLDSLSVDHLLVYTNYKQIDEAQARLNERGIRQHKFTAHEGLSERADILDRFASGDLDALVAMKCLDEGVDIPSTKQAILMSNSGNPKQFIQRRGRLLRKAPGKEKAVIYDFLVAPTKYPDETLANSEQQFLRRELDRFEEFATTAQNELEARNRIQPIRTRYALQNAHNAQ